MKTINLAQSLAIDSQLRLPGSAGRILKNIRDIEKIAPMFRDVGLVKPVPKLSIVDMNVAGISTRSCVTKALGGFIYVSAAVRIDLLIEQNKLSSGATDSISELDDIDFEAQAKRLELIQIRQTYSLLEKIFNSAHSYNLILIDTPFFLARDMAPLDRHKKHKQEYEKTKKVIESFWDRFRQSIFPWNPNGPVVASILAERFSAIVSIAKQDLRTAEGRSQILENDGFDALMIKQLDEIEEQLIGIGDLRFINGILGNFTRTIAFRSHQLENRIEPVKEVQQGLIGFHFRSSRQGQIKFVQLVGDEPAWTSESLDIVASRLMALDMQNKGKAMPLPQLLGYQQLNILPQFAEFYRKGLHNAVKQNEVELGWLESLEGEE
ncbi:hypothetical protein SAMN05444586_10269 [Acinetobacter bohemicus]|uniref:NurA domain-containing protein n=1 Tax=Acinetobacter bohemicus TaxID=1435036 RepID=A0A1I6VHL2_9GAMM|nr:hypothetical protein [Acinetobacter bohemicus]SFT13137.1 hypothetical protein SAMN05444586_10269 [Acinetobacter bohemicus]